MVDISIIIPVYNVDKYIHECVESVIEQKFERFELILVNDGSTDKSGDICEFYAQRDRRITVLHQKNQGQSVARNSGVLHAKGEWICFIDSDDVVHPYYLESLYNAVKEYAVEFSMCDHLSGEKVRKDFWDCDVKNFELMQMDENLLFDMAQWGRYGLRYGVVWGKLIKKEIVQKYPFTEGKIYEDTPVVCKWFYETKKVANSREKLYFYRNNPNSTVTAKFTKKQLDKLWCWEVQEKFYKEIGYYKLRNMAIKEYILVARNFIPQLKKVDKLEIVKMWARILIKFGMNCRNLEKHERHFIINELFPGIRKQYLKIKK